MRVHPAIFMLMLSLAAGLAHGQESGSAPAAAQQNDSGQVNTPAPAYGQENPPLPVSENPPLSGLDLPGLEPKGAPLSYLQPGGHLSESADSNVTDSLGGSNTRSITRALGSLDLQRLWSNYKLALDYVGGVGYYDAHGLGFRQVQQFDVDQRISWKRGQLGLRDSFSYLPEGTFGGAYGSILSQGELLGAGAFGGQNSFMGGNSFGALGQVPRIMNMALVDVTQNLTPKSSVTASAGYDLVHFTQDLTDPQTGNPLSFIGSHEFSVQLGYNRVLTPHNQVAVVYGYQNFDFTVTGFNFHSNVVQLMWGHRVSGRMDFMIAAGPQFTEIDSFGSQTQRITGAGRLMLRYKFPRATMSLTAYRYNTSGSGFFAGAESNVARLNGNRSLGRVWSAFGDLGFAYNKRLQQVSSSQAFGISANNYSYGFAAVGVHRMIGHDFRLYGSYEFNYLTVDSSFCANSNPPGEACTRVSRRHVGTIGLDWTPRPIRLD